MDCGPPGSSLHGISQARILQWVAISFPRGSFWPRDLGCVSCIRQEDSLPLSHQGSPTETHRIKNKLEMHIKLILKFYLFIYRYLAVSALSCSKWDLLLQRASSIVAAHPDCACVCAQLLQSCPTPCDRMDCSCLLLCPWDSPGKNTGVGCHVLLQEISQPRDQTHVSCTAGGFFIPTEQPGKPMTISRYNLFDQQMDIRSMFSFQPW